MPENDPMAYTEASEADVAGKLEEYDATAQEAALQQVGEAPPAKMPLTPNRVNALAETTVRAIETLSDGQVQVGEPVTIAEPVDALPPQLYQQVSAFAQVPSMAGMEEYSFDPAEESTTDDGLLRMANMIDQMSNDKKVKNAMMQPQGPQEEVVEEEVAVDEISEDEFATLA